ncbi:MAG: hypothetical protein IK025_07990 [Bacteroidales bacterium]|nr:hypothetical protein [Bacteroidales bacterium]
MYTQEEFIKKVKEWLKEEDLPFRGQWDIERDVQSNNSVCISVAISSDKLIINKDDNEGINIPSYSSSSTVIDDDEHLKKEVIVLYHSVFDLFDNSLIGVLGM